MFEFYKIELSFHLWNDVSTREESPKWAQKRNVQETWLGIDSPVCDIRQVLPCPGAPFSSVKCDLQTSILQECGDD